MTRSFFGFSFLFLFLTLIFSLCLNSGDAPRSFKCRWCMGLFIRGSRSHYNLYAHRDGAKGRAPCPRRARAIQFGLVLPNSWAQEQAENAQELTEANGQNTLDAFLSQLTFSVELCNIVLVIWILWHTLPFNRLYDFPLRAAFKLANRRADLRSPTWAAGISKDLYLNLSLEVIYLV